MHEKNGVSLKLTIKVFRNKERLGVRKYRLLFAGSRPRDIN